MNFAIQKPKKFKVNRLTLMSTSCYRCKKKERNAPIFHKLRKWLFLTFFFASLIQVTFHKKCFIKIFSTSTIFGKMFKEYLENTQTFVQERKSNRTINIVNLIKDRGNHWTVIRVIFFIILKNRKYSYSCVITIIWLTYIFLLLIDLVGTNFFFLNLYEHVRNQRD
jgi:hypothetical protein